MAELEKKCKFTRLVSTTDRPMRHNETEGVDYFFISKEESERLEEQDMFAELVTYNGVRYGVTHAEMEGKMSDLSRPPMVIVEPSGVEIYRKYCAEKKWGLFSVFVSTTEDIRLSRLVNRTTLDLLRAVKLPDVNAHNLPEKIGSVVHANNHRLKAMLDSERLWQARESWSVMVDGTDTLKAVRDIELAINIRNARAAVYE